MKSFKFSLKRAVLGILIAILSLGIAGPAWASPIGGKPPVHPIRPHVELNKHNNDTGKWGKGKNQSFDPSQSRTPGEEGKFSPSESLKAKLETANDHRTVKVFDDIPHLLVRSTDSDEHDAEVAKIARNILEPMFARPVSLNKITVALTLPVLDSKTDKIFRESIPAQARKKRQRFVNLLDNLSVKSELNPTQRIELLKEWAGELVIIIGHRNPESGYFEYIKKDGTKAEPIDIKLLEEQAAEAAVLLLAIGCKSGLSTSFGPERNLNSVDVVQDVTRGLTMLESGPQELRTFYKGLATERMALSIDVLHFRDTRKLEPIDDQGRSLEGEIRVPPLATSRPFSLPKPGWQEESSPEVVYQAPPCPWLARLRDFEVVVAVLIAQAFITTLLIIKSYIGVRKAPLTLFISILASGSVAYVISAATTFFTLGAMSLASQGSIVGTVFLGFGAASCANGLSEYTLSESKSANSHPVLRWCMPLYYGVTLGCVAVAPFYGLICPLFSK